MSGRRGTRCIGGRYFLLFNAGSWIPGLDEDPESDQRIWHDREVAAARRQWEMVRVIKDRRRYRVFIYVFGRKD